jgi:hypothetical protein
MSMKGIAAAALCALAITAASARVADDHARRPTPESLELLRDLRIRPLKGLEGFVVLVGRPETAEEVAGLTREELQRDLELRLRIAGVKVIPVEDLWKKDVPPHGTLIFQETAITASIADPPLVFSCELNVLQDATLASGDHPKIGARTWWINSVHRGGKLRESVRAALNDLTDEFLNDYLKANPKK